MTPSEFQAEKTLTGMQYVRRAVQAVVSRNAKQRMAESLSVALRTMRR